MNRKLNFTISTFLLLTAFIQGELAETRRKRYISFPKGTALSVQICLTYQMGITPGSIFTEAVNWGINYPLEIKEEMMVNLENGERSLRRERRDLLGRIEKMLYHLGYDGRHCILRALCEFSSIFGTSNSNMEGELLKIFFEYTSEWSFQYESKEDEIYHAAQKLGQYIDPRLCFETYPKCHFSLLNVLTGKHSVENMLNYMRR